MEKISKVAIWFMVPLAALYLYAQFVHWIQRRYVPPPDITTVGEVLEWTGRPWWVSRYTSPTVTYYEIGKKVSVWTEVLTLASGAPSYTVDQNGRFIGWSRDSGDIHTPDVLKSRELKRDSIDVDEFIQLAKEMRPNQASDATSEPAPGAAFTTPNRSHSRVSAQFTLAGLPESHPLMHPKAWINTAPRSIHVIGMINLNTAIRYVLGTTEEAVSARKLLEESGFGPKGEHYLFCTKNKAVADGKVFPNATEAIAYLKDTKVEAALYLTDEDQFPRQIPAELTYTGLALRALDWHK